MIALLVVTAALLAGYVWGTRRNRRLLKTITDILIERVRPTETEFTNIGGLIGCSATLIPPAAGPFESVEATLTLLPRHAWLYYPFSRAVMKHDRLFIALALKAEAAAGLEEGHLIELRHSRTSAGCIRNAAELDLEPLDWGGVPFRLYFASAGVRGHLRDLVRRLNAPGVLRHAALVPEHDRVFFFLRADPARLDECLAVLLEWAAGPADGGRGA